MWKQQWLNIEATSGLLMETLSWYNLWRQIRPEWEQQSRKGRSETHSCWRNWWEWTVPEKTTAVGSFGPLWLCYWESDWVTLWVIKQVLRHKAGQGYVYVSVCISYKSTVKAMQLFHSGLFGFTNRYKPEANQKYPQITVMHFHLCFTNVLLVIK